VDLPVGFRFEDSGGGAATDEEEMRTFFWGQGGPAEYKGRAFKPVGPCKQSNPEEFPKRHRLQHLPERPPAT